MTTSNEDQGKLSTNLPSWLVHIEERIEEERDEFRLESPYYEIVPEAEDEIRRPPEYSAGHKLNTIASVAFETADEVFCTTYQHDRLAELLIGIKKEAAGEYNIENPKFVYYAWGVDNAANESWNAGHVDALTQGFATEPKDVWAEAWINTAALIAKLFQGGLLDADGARWIADDFERAFDANTKWDLKGRARMAHDRMVELYP